ncbi:hypothetical protein CK203_088244 [Vitis vinifera]|uniref:Uncharacterized protein n=1 Tax=Vitis vinifera TaxID=29760 RepID=A0A438FJQ2_VITVI|nr:hypothetical protein CK203_088244 [Vitis vinifera]
MVRTLTRGAANRSHLIGPKEGEFSWKPVQDVHKKKLQRADCIPLLFPRLLCQVLEHLGYPSEPQQERKRICREPFTLDKWNNMTAYKIDQPGQPHQRKRASQDITEAEPRMPSLYPSIESCVVHWRLLQLLKQSAQELAAIKHAGADVPPGSTSPPRQPKSISICHSCRAPHTPPEPHSQPSESHPPESEVPADPPTEEADPSA